MCLREKNYQLHTSFVVTYAVPLGFTTAHFQDLESTSQAAIFLPLSTMKSEFLCLRKTCGTSAKTYRNPKYYSQNKHLPTLFCSEPQSSPSRHFFNMNSMLACVQFMNSDYLVPLKVTVAEKGVSNLFQSTQKRVRELYSCHLDRDTAQVRKLAMEKETPLCANQPAGRTVRPRNCRVHPPSLPLSEALI